MYKVQMTKTFRKDVERCRKRGYDLNILKEAIRRLEIDGKLPQDIVLINYRDNMQVVGSVI